MEKGIEQLQLGTDTFFVDQQKGALILDGEAATHLRFASMDTPIFKDGSTHYRRLLYDTESKEQFLPDPAKGVLPSYVKLLEIPHERFLYGQGAKSQELPDLLKLDMRDYLQAGTYLAREIPRRLIFGTEFFVDSMLLELRQVNDPKNKISFDDVSLNNERIYFDYNTAYKNIPRPADIFSDSNKTAFLPLLKVLDPLIWSRIDKGEIYIDKTLSSRLPSHGRQPRKLSNLPDRPKGLRS